MIQRRSFLTGLAGLIAAPAIVRAGIIMPVKPLPLAGVCGHQAAVMLIGDPAERIYVNPNQYYDSFGEGRLTFRSIAAAYQHITGRSWPEGFQPAITILPGVYDNALRFE